jgi:hypothetical protein
MNGVNLEITVRKRTPPEYQASLLVFRISRKSGKKWGIISRFDNSKPFKTKNMTEPLKMDWVDNHCFKRENRYPRKD